MMVACLSLSRGSYSGAGAPACDASDGWAHLPHAADHEADDKTLAARGLRDALDNESWF